MLKAILFDRDGTLLDSGEINRQFYRDLMEKAGYSKPLDTEVEKVLSQTVWDAIKTLTKQENQSEIERIFDLKFEISYHTELIKIPLEEIEILKKLVKKYKLALVTNALKRGVDFFYKASGLREYFSTAVSFEDFKNPKPDPEPLLIACQKLEIKPEEAVYVGDSLVDLEAAHAVGMKFINLNVFNPEKVPGADFYAKDFKDLEEIILGL